MNRRQLNRALALALSVCVGLAGLAWILPTLRIQRRDTLAKPPIVTAADAEQTIIRRTADCTPLVGLDFSWSPVTPTTTQTVTFTGVVSSGSGPAHYAWQWGAGAPDGAGNPAYHTFTASGTYTVLLTSTNACSLITAAHTIASTGPPFTPTYGASLSPPVDARSGPAGEAVTYTLTLSNTGDVADRFAMTWTTSGEAWAVDVFPTRTDTLPPGGTGAATVSVHIPPTADAGRQSVCTLTARSAASSVVSDSSLLTTTVEAVAPDFTTSYKSGPSTAVTDEIITYTIVAVNTGGPVSDVVLSDNLPYTARYIPGSCTYWRAGETPQACGPLDHLWQADFASGARMTMTTTFAVQVTAGSMNWPVVNCATLDWPTGQHRTCRTTVINQIGYTVYLPLVMRAYAPQPAVSYPFLDFQVDVGGPPNSLAIDEAGRRVFVAHANGLTVIDADAYQTLEEVNLPFAFDAAYDAGRDRIWVSLQQADRVVVLDGATYAQIADLPAGGGPKYVAYNPSNDRVYVTTNYGSGTINVYQASDPGYERTIDHNVKDPGQIAINPVTNRIYVPNHVIHGQMNVIDGETHQTRLVSVGLFDAFGAAVDVSRNLIYVSSVGEGRLAIIDGQTEELVDKFNLRRSDGRAIPLLVLAANPNLGPAGHLWLVTSSAETDGEDQALLIHRWPAVSASRTIDQLQDFQSGIPIDLARAPKWGIAIDRQTNRVWIPSIESELVNVVQDGEPVDEGLVGW